MHPGVFGLRMRKRLKIGEMSFRPLQRSAKLHEKKELATCVAAL
jgi:hypothetical protein